MGYLILRILDQTAQKQSSDVFLMFLVRTEDKEVDSLKVKIRIKYCDPDIPYYLEAGK
jgi:hypothetical protein